MLTENFRGFLKVPLFLIAGVGLMMLLSSSSVRNFPHELAGYRAMWDAQGITNYRMDLESTFFPQPPVAVELIVRHNEIIKATIIACNNPSEEYPETLCEPVRRYYSQMGRFTIAQLFDRADVCIRETRAAFAGCPMVVDSKLQEFSDFDALANAARDCQDSLPHDSQIQLCAVIYDPDFGYPAIISLYARGVEDGFGRISVKEFQPTS